MWNVQMRIRHYVFAVDNKARGQLYASQHHECTHVTLDCTFMLWHLEVCVMPTDGFASAGGDNIGQLTHQMYLHAQQQHGN